MIVKENGMGLFDLFKKKEKSTQAAQTKKQEGTIPQTKKGDYQPEDVTRML